MLWHNLRYAFRMIVREPAFSAAAILTLALGVGANVAVFAVVESVLLRPLPYPDADRLLILNNRDRRTGITKEFIAIGDYVDLAERQTTVEALVAYGSGQATIFGDDEPVRVSALSAAPGLFETLRVSPALGRPLAAADSRQGAAPVAVLGYEIWQSHFGSDPDIVGRSIRVGTERRQIVGVAPRGFRFPPSQERTGLIVPMHVPDAAPAARKSGWVFAVARLRPEASYDHAVTNFAALAGALEHEHASQNQGSEYFPVSLRESLVGDTRRPLVLMLAAVAIVLLVACANVGNLMLSRAFGRTREMAVRAALGAGRGQLAAQLLAESLVLAVVAGAVGVALAYWGAPALVALVPRSVAVPGLHDVGINRGVLAFALGVTVLTALVFGSIAAFAGRPEAARALGTRGEAGATRVARRAASALVICEVALAIVLLVGAGLILRSFARLLAVDPGFRTDNVLTMNVALPADRYGNAEVRRAFYDRAFPAIRGLPGIAHVGAAVVTPLTGNNWTVPFERADRPVPSGERAPDVGWQLASGHYFRALDIPLRAGRLFDANDGPGSPTVVIISAAIERQFFAGENPVGRRVRLGKETAEIVGVVGDIRRAGLTDQPRADMYFPFEHAPQLSITLFVRTGGDPASATAPITSALKAIEPSILVTGSSTLAVVARESTSTTRLMLWLLGIFAAVALTLASIGVYGVMSYAVGQRAREIGTRMALGATGRDILWSIMRQGLAITALGLAIGLTAALAATQSLNALLYDVNAADPPTFLVAAGTLAVSTLGACYFPARRAARIDPAHTLTRI
jgi:putative ABC transport system permease protein